MPTQQAFPTVNEHECSWADIGLTINIAGGKTVQGIDWEGIKYSRKVEVGESRGTSGGRVMKRTAGSESVEASGSTTRSGWIALIEAIEEAAATEPKFVRGNEVAISGVAFDILIQHTPVGSDRIYTTKLVGCRYLGDSDDMKQGNEADMLELTLNPIRILTKSASGRWMTLR
jgi:hypothetical protein